MKKIIIILFFGLFNLMGFAQAQSDVKLYGRVSIGYGASNGGDIEGAPGRDGKFQQWGNGMTASRWGLLGKEDLGKGMNVYFKLESGIDPETGATKGFNRAAFVGLATPFGQFQLGRQNTVVDNILSPYTYLENPGQACALCNVQVSSSQRSSRYNSALVYFSPQWNGLSAQVGFVSKNNEAGVGNIGEKNLWTFGVTLQRDKFQLGLAYESKLTDQKDTAPSWGLAMKYKFDAFTLGGGYMDNHDKSDGKGVYADIVVPFGAFHVGGQLAYNFKAYSPVDNKKIKPFSVGLFSTYHLSKRTRIYALYGYINDDAQEFAKASRHNTYVIGLVNHF